MVAISTPTASTALNGPRFIARKVRPIAWARFSICNASFFTLPEKAKAISRRFPNAAVAKLPRSDRDV